MEQITLQPTELRIGNWVNWKDNGIIRIVTISQNDGANSGSSWNTWTKFEDLEGIPLTPAILEAAGFKMSITKTCYGIITEDGRLRISIFTDGRIKIETTDLSCKIEYLHQLQNLYFALCGKELEITL